MTLIDEETEAPEVPLVEVAGPGVYDMPAEQYHARPELSSSGMRKLIDSCPALFKWEQANPPHKDEWDIGNAAHALVLSAGADMERIKKLDFDNWRTNAAKAAKAAAYAAGQIPILEKDFAHVKAMVWQVKNHPVARWLFTEGKPEQSLFWNDAKTGQPLRARVDWLRNPREGKRLVIIDYKTTTEVDPESISRTIYNLGYHQQAALYREAAMALGLGGRDTVVTFVFQMKTPPYLVHVTQVPGPDLDLGSARNRVAIKTYRACVATGEWPGYEETSRIEIPVWGQNRDQLEYA